MPTRLRKIRPKQPGLLPQAQPSEQPRPQPPRARGLSTTVACNRCRMKKIKCDGQRPICKFCSKSGAECVFDAHPGESRAQMLRRENQELKVRLANAEWLLAAILQGPSHTRAWIHEALSAGARPDGVFQQLHMALQLDPDGQATSSQRNTYAAPGTPDSGEPKDSSVAPNRWKGPNPNTDSWPYGSAPSSMEDGFPSSHSDSFELGAQ